MKWLLVRLVFFFAVWSVAPSATADEASEAQLQYELGVELYKQERYPEAIERFIASNRLVPNANVVANIAKTFEFLKRPMDAYNWHCRYLDFDLTSDQRVEGEVALSRLLPEVAVVSVTTKPAGAVLFIDRVDLGSVGSAPRRLAVAAGERKVIAQAPGFHPAEVPATATLGEITFVQLALVPLVGTVKITTSPPGAKITLEEGPELGASPLSTEVRVGSYTLSVSLDGYQTQTKKITVGDGETTQLAFELKRDLSSVAVLSVQGNVPGAEVIFGGKRVGAIPLSDLELEPQTGALEVRAPGREPYLSTVVLEKGAVTRVKVSLADPNDGPWLGFRYLGFGIGGAVLGAGAGVGIASITQRARFFDDPTSDRYDRVARLNTTADVLLITGAVIVLGTTIWEILKAPAPVSTGKVEVDR